MPTAKVKLDTKLLCDYAYKEGLAALRIGADRISSRAYRNCPVSDIERNGKIVSRQVKFWAGKTKKSKKKTWVSFTAKMDTSRTPGALRASIHTSERDVRGRTNIRVFAGNKDVYWGHWVEYGSVHNKKPAAFMRKAKQAEQRVIRKMMMQAMKVATDRMNGICK